MTTLTLEEFKDKYYNMRTEDLAKELKVSSPTILKMARKYNLGKKTAGRKKGNTKIKIIGESNV